MTLHILILLTIAFLTCIVAPIALVWTFIAGMREKASDRPSGGYSSTLNPEPRARKCSRNRSEPAHE
jgi:hypothetical protein